MPLILNNTSAARVVTNNVALAAGWHSVEFRYAQGTGAVGPQGDFRNGILYDAENGGFTNATELARARMFTDDGGPNLITESADNFLSGMLALAQDGTLSVPARGRQPGYGVWRYRIDGRSARTGLDHQ